MPPYMTVEQYMGTSMYFAGHTRYSFKFELKDPFAGTSLCFLSSSTVLWLPYVLWRSSSDWHC